MKTLQNISSYLLGLIAFFMPKLTDTLEVALKEVIARMRVDGLAEQANQILYIQEQEAILGEMELTIKLVGVAVSVTVALFLYFKDIKAIHGGFYYFWIQLSCFAQKVKSLIVKYLTLIYQKASNLLKKVF